MEESSRTFSTDEEEVVETISQSNLSLGGKFGVSRCEMKVGRFLPRS